VPIGVQDDFFELGGNSILAARLFTGIEKAFGKKLPLNTLLQAPTIEQGARLLHQGDERVRELPLAMGAVVQDKPEKIWGPLVPIQPLVPESDQPVLFLVHVLGGHLLRYTELTRLLGQDQPVYGFQSRGLVDGMEAQDDIQEMAADYIQAMKRVQPEGPYTLGGFCFGGVVAYEMARQLEQGGESVTFLGIFEGAAPLRGEQKRSLWRDPGAALFFARNLLYWSWSTLQLGPVRMTENLVSSVKRRVKMVLRKLGLMERSESGGLRDLPPHETKQGGKVLAAHMSAMRHYQPGEYNDRLALFRIRAQPPLRYTNSKLGWDHVAREVDVHIFATAHETLLEQPHVQQVVEELKRYLDSAQF
jgi:thioesterase domain-containing protein